MSVFADFVLETGPERRDKIPTRSGAWETVADYPSGRLRISRPADRPAPAACARTRDRAAWVIGEIHRYEGRTAPTADCLRRFLENDLKNPQTLSGRFAIAAWSAEASEWSVWTDRVGAMQAYLVESARVVSSFSGAAYRYSSGKLDWEGLAGFFSLGFFPGDRTYYSDCRILRPASRYTFDSHGALDAARYWDWTHRPDHSRSESDTIAEFGSRLTSVVAVHLNAGRVALPLSGGLDSRTVAACLPKDSGAAAFGYGYGADSEEIRIAAEVAAAANLPFHAHTIRPYLFDELSEVVDAVEGFQDLTQTRQASIAPWLSHHFDSVLGGHWGDVLCDTLGVPAGASQEETLHKLASKMRKAGSAWLIENLCGPQLEADASSAVTQSLRGELARYESISDPDFRAKVVKTEQWAFRWTLPSIRMYQAGATPRLPFLDPEMLDFFVTVPTEFVAGRRLQVEYLKRHAPAFARIRWQAYDANLFRYPYFGTLQLPRRAWKRMQRMLDRRPKIKRNWEVQVSPQRAQLRELILGRESLAREFVAPGKLEALLDEFATQPNASNGYTVSMLLTFCAWGRHFANHEA